MNSKSVSLQAVGDGYNVLVNGQALYSRYKPKHGAERGLLAAEKATLYFVPCPLLGYGLDKFLQTLPDDSHIIAVEYHDELISLTKQHQSTWQTAQIDVLFQPRIEDIDALLKNKNLDQFQQCVLLQLNQGFQLFNEQYTQILNFCRYSIYVHHQNKAIFKQNGDLWLKNLLTNLSFFPHTATYNLTPSEDPIVIAGAGTSLEINLPQLRQFRPCFRLVAVDTALPCLLAHDIDPDLVFVLESSYHNLQDFIPCQRRPVAILRDLTSLPQQARFPSTFQSFFFTKFAHISLLDRLSSATNLLQIPPLGSVGIAAIAFALKITHGPIFFTGLDFSFPLGKNHARGAYSHNMTLQNWSRLSPNLTLIQQLNRPLIAQKNGLDEIVYTDALMLHYAQMASQSDAKRIFSLSLVGLPLGYPHGSLGRLKPCHHSWDFFKKTKKSHSLKDFARQELVLLKRFFDQDPSVLPTVDYLFLGHDINEKQKIFTNANILSRATYMRTLWQNIEAGKIFSKGINDECG